MVRRWLPLTARTETRIIRWLGSLDSTSTSISAVDLNGDGDLDAPVDVEVAR
jgi:hypothetical protein